MKNRQNLKKESYLGFFLLLGALMLFATIVKSCNIASYQAQKQTINTSNAHETRQQ